MWDVSINPFLGLQSGTANRFQQLREDDTYIVKSNVELPTEIQKTAPHVYVPPKPRIIDPAKKPATIMTGLYPNCNQIVTSFEGIKLKKQQINLFLIE